MALTDEAIEKIRAMITSGELGPATACPASRSSARSWVCLAHRQRLEP
jgi:hypothetical protein